MPPLPPPETAWEPPTTAAALPGGPGQYSIKVEQEGLGRSMLRAGLKTVAVLAVLSVVPMTMIFLFGLLAAAVVGGGAVDPAVSGPVDTNLNRSYLAGETDGETRLVSVPVVGPIMGENRDGDSFFSAVGVTYGYTVKEELARLAEDEDVDGVLLEMSTPGGTIFGSQAIADGVAEYQAATGKPVVAYVADISASGGMLAMAGADEIVADHGTFIGSIGVIFGPLTRYEDITAVDGGILGGGVSTEGGITFEYLTAGRSKDVGSPYREITPEERRILQEGLDDAYDGFVNHVADSRDLSPATIRNDLGAMIFGEEQALKRGLIDLVGPRETAYDQLATLAGAEGGDWRLDRIEAPVPGLLDLLGARVDDAPPTASVPAFCTGAPVLLAFHGDPTTVCEPGE